VSSLESFQLFPSFAGFVLTTVSRPCQIRGRGPIRKQSLWGYNSFESDHRSVGLQTRLTSSAPTRGDFFSSNFRYHWTTIRLLSRPSAAFLTLITRQ